MRRHPDDSRLGFKTDRQEDAAALHIGLGQAF
jgi:hypothetical protein